MKLDIFITNKFQSSHYKWWQGYHSIHRT